MGRTAFDWTKTNSCIKDRELFDFQSLPTIENFKKSTTASIKLNAEIKGIFKLLRTEWNYVDSVDLEFKESRIVAPDDESIVDMVSDRYKSDYCRSRVFNGPKPTYVVTSACEAIYDMKIYFKNNIEVDIVDAVIEKMKLSFGAEGTLPISNWRTGSSASNSF